VAYFVIWKKPLIVSSQYFVVKTRILWHNR